MIYGSVCSGIEAATVAWHPLGWKPAWFAEIDKFPSAVLAHHYPEVPNLGDIYDIRLDITSQEARERFSIDLLVGGFPCQDLSVAGKRTGLKNEDGTPTRSGLFFRIVEIADAIGQRWTLLENVPGLLSSSEGRDLAVVVGELAGAKIDVPDSGWQNAGFVSGPKGLVEWAVLDAQYFGVPQRRRRIFIIRDSGDWRSRPPILLERESLLGNPAPSREAEEGAAPTISARTKGGGGLGTDFDCNGGLIAHTLTVRHGAIEDGTGRGTPLVACALNAKGGSGRIDGESETFIPVAFHHSDGGRDAQLGLSMTLRSGGDGNYPSACASTGNGVRRLTPRECERLQGFDDDYTLIPYRGKPAADGPRYKALGNSMAVPCMRWIGQRIQMVDAIAQEAA